MRDEPPRTPHSRRLEEGAMITTRRFIVMGLAASLVSLSLAGPAAAQRTPGVTDDTITIGILGSLTGPAAIWGSGNLIAGTMYFTKINEAGGVHGRKIKWIVEDDGSQPPKGIAAFKKLVSDNVFAVFGPSTSAVVAAARPTLDASGVPTFISIPSTPRATDPFAKNVFRTGPLNDTLQGYLVADFAVGQLKGKRVALLSQSDEYGQRGADSVVKRLKEKHGVTPVAHEVFNVADTDFTSQVLKVRDAKADVLIVYSYIAPSSTIVRQAKQLGVEAKIIGSNATSSRLYPKVVGESAVGVLNVITVADLPESNHPTMAKFREEFERQNPTLVPQGRPDLTDLLAFGGAMVFVEGLKRAGRDLTREKFIAALETIRNFESGFSLPTTFTPTDHEGNKAARILEIQPGGQRKLLDVILRAE
jgi:branched-chain amino acid transport system substrate-binding protein